MRSTTQCCDGWGGGDLTHEFSVGAAEGCDKAGTAFTMHSPATGFPVDRSLRQLLQNEFAVKTKFSAALRFC